MPIHIPLSDKDKGVHIEDKITKEKIRQMFQKADVNKDKRLDQTEVKKVFKDLGLHFAGWRAGRAIRATDVDGDHFIDADKELENLVNYAYKKYGDK